MQQIHRGRTARDAASLFTATLQENYETRYTSHPCIDITTPSAYSIFLLSHTLTKDRIFFFSRYRHGHALLLIRARSEQAGSRFLGTCVHLLGTCVCDLPHD